MHNNRICAKLSKETEQAIKLNKRSSVRDLWDNPKQSIAYETALLAGHREDRKTVRSGSQNFSKFDVNSI
jgi:hypothetical protein